MQTGAWWGVGVCGCFWVVAEFWFCGRLVGFLGFTDFVVGFGGFVVYCVCVGGSTL